MGKSQLEKRQPPSEEEGIGTGFPVRRFADATAHKTAAVVRSTGELTPGSRLARSLPNIIPLMLQDVKVHAAIRSSTGPLSAGSERGIVQVLASRVRYQDSVPTVSLGREGRVF